MIHRSRLNNSIILRRMKIFIDFSRLSDGVTDCPTDIISKIICLINKQNLNTAENSCLLRGSMNKDGNTFLPLDPIVKYACNCPSLHEFRVHSKVEFVFYAVKLI